jgi:Haem-degrading
VSSLSPGGVALYLNGKVIGGLGVSGDSACADHVIAYRMRKAVVLDRIPSGVGVNGTDDIDYLAVGAAPAGFKHPHCSDHDFAPGTY